MFGSSEDGSSFATHSVAFFIGCVLRSKVYSLVSSSSNVCKMKNCASSATSEEDVVFSMEVVCMSSCILKWTFSLTVSSSLGKKSAVVLTETAICAVLKSNCNTSLHAFYSVGGLDFSKRSLNGLRIC